MKILITDSIDQEGIDILTAQEGFEVVVDHSLKDDKLAENIGQYHALITRSGTYYEKRDRCDYGNPGKSQ